ncbi:hypothetical protein DL93DRAFT_2077563 [Clavulina sp. PMI_390]|nr:hypothetical protein DL93DRAFT_2077563 [Clavulina sp. PMI_390]
MFCTKAEANELREILWRPIDNDVFECDSPLMTPGGTGTWRYCLKHIAKTPERRNV